MDTIQQTKVELRQQILSARRALSAVEHERESQVLAERLYALPVWQSARCVGLYASAPDEAATDGIITEAFKSGKIVVLPKMQNEKCKMKNITWHTITSLNDLEVGAFGIREPKTRMGEMVALSALNLLLVPGVAFDVSGGRLGYGGGFYDRVLQSFTGQTISLALSCQIVQEVPMEAHDVRVGMVLTPMD